MPFIPIEQFEQKESTTPPSKGGFIPIEQFETSSQLSPMEQLDRINKPVPVTPQPRDTRNILGKARDTVAGGIEATASLATGTLASSAAGWTSAGKDLAAKVLNLPRDGDQTAQKIIEFFTYEPRTEEGKQINELMGEFVSKYAMAGAPHLPSAIPLARGVAQRYGMGGTAERAMPAKPPQAPPPQQPPPQEPPKAPPPERGEFIKEIERKAKLPLVETAFRNKETGEIIKSGPKHDLEMKKNPKFEQGFVDEEGQFHNRDEATGQAKRSGQIPEDHVLEQPKGEEPGLHSGDLRTAKDPRFELPKEEEKAPEPPKEDQEQKAPQTRREYFAGLEKRQQDLDARIYEIEQKANSMPPEELAKANAEVNAEQKAIEKARGDAPEAKVVDKTKPTSEEIHDILAGHSNVGEALDILIKGGYGGKAQQWLLKRLSKIDKIRNANLLLDFEGKTIPKGKNWAGLYDGNNHTISIFGGEHRGSGLQTVLHEGIHAATHALIEEGSHASVRVLNNIYNRAEAAYKRSQLAKGMTEAEYNQRKADGTLPDYGYTDLHEFVSEAFTTPEFQTLLKALPFDVNLPTAKNAWTKFKEAIKEALGVPSEHQSALDQILDHGSKIIESKKKVSGDYGWSPDKVEPKGSVTDLGEYKKQKEKETLDKRVDTLIGEHADAFKEAYWKDRWESMKNWIPESVDEYFEDWLGDSYGRFGREEAMSPERMQDTQRRFLEEIIDYSDDWEPHQVAAVKKALADMEGRPYLEPKGSQTTTKAEPIPNIRDIKDQADFEAKTLEIYKTHGKEAAEKFYDQWQESKKTMVEAVADTEKFVGMNLQNKMANERVIKNTAEELRTGIPDSKEAEINIIRAIETDRVSSLPEEQQVVAKKYIEEMKRIGEEAKQEGVIKGLIENYVTHIIEWVDTRGVPADQAALAKIKEALFGSQARDPSMRNMSPESRFGKHRSMPTMEDLERYIAEANARIEAKGESDWRMQIKSKNLGDIYETYATSMMRATENAKLINSVKGLRNLNGEALLRDISKDSPIPEGWEVGEGPLAGMAIHPDLMPALKFVFDAGPGEIMRALGTVSQITKRLNVVGSFFHAKSLLEVLSSAKIPVWSAVKEGVVQPLWDKATGQSTSPISKAIDQFRKGGLGDNVDKWMREGGLVLEVPEDVTRSILTDVAKYGDALISKYGPKTRALEKGMSTVEKYTLRMFDKYTWDYLHTGIKLSVADSYLSKARINALKEGKPFDEVAARKEIARFLNNAAGGLNWFDEARQVHTKFDSALGEAGRKIDRGTGKILMSSFSPEGRRALQVALFAPDWTISTIRAFTAALPKELNPTKWHPVEGVKGMMNPTTKADYARLYQFKTALTYLLLLNTFNQMTAGRNIWDNKDPTRIEFKDGTSMQAMKHAMEPYHWIMDADKTLSNKLGFVPKAAIVGIAGTEYAGPQAQKLTDPSAMGRMSAIAKMVAPFQIQAAAGAPEGEGLKRAALGTMGLPVYGGNAEQKKAARATREKELKQKAKDYHKKAKEKGWE